MTPRDLWTEKRDFYRNLRNDFRIIGPDLLIGIGYVLVAFGFPTSIPATVANNLLFPTVAMCFVLCYFAIRICGPERDDKLSMFYANLPRRKMLTFWTHVFTLGICSILLLSATLLGLWVKVKYFGLPWSESISPLVFLGPWLSIAGALWFMYVTGFWSGQWPTLAKILGIIVMYPSLILILGAVTLMPPVIQIVILLLAVVFMLRHASACWKRLQIGLLQ